MCVIGAKCHVTELDSRRVLVGTPGTQGAGFDHQTRLNSRCCLQDSLMRHTVRCTGLARLQGRDPFRAAHNTRISSVRPPFYSLLEDIVMQRGNIWKFRAALKPIDPFRAAHNTRISATRPPCYSLLEKVVMLGTSYLAATKIRLDHHTIPSGNQNAGLEVVSKG